MEPQATADPRRRLPAVDRVLEEPAILALIALYGRERVRVQVRAELASLRFHLTGGEAAPRDLAPELTGLPERVRRGLEAALGRPLERVLNATGIFLHTNLGRAPLPREVAALLPSRLDAACDLELELATGRRGDRNRRVEALLVALTGAEAALVVNNNAATLILVLATLARGREVIVSRGELVEIGGSFRIPEILEAAGARLVEVGSTNRTHLADYEHHIGEPTAMLLKIFPSNYRVSGYVAGVEPAALAALARARSVPLLVDEGSGLLRSHPAPQLADHPSFAALVAAGCDLVCGSGDKLLGGPQAGLLVGRRELVARCRRHPLYRALRPDRAGLAALEEVLRRRLVGAPFPLDGLWPDPKAHSARLARMAAELGAQRVPAEAFVGGGSAPEAPIAGEALSLPGSDELLRSLRLGTPPVVGYLRQGRLLLDLRTVDPRDDDALRDAVLGALARCASISPKEP